MNLKFGVLSVAILLGGLSIFLGGVHEPSTQRGLLQSVAVLVQDGGYPLLALAMLVFAQYLSLTGLAVLLRPLRRALRDYLSGRCHRG